LVLARRCFENNALIWKSGTPVEQDLLTETLLTNTFPEGYVTELHTRQLLGCIRLPNIA
jgi:hypothetical protein